MSEDSDRWAVVSGGGTGIGRAITRALADDGYRIVVVGRRSAPLESVAADIGRDTVHICTGDLTDPGDVERVRGGIAEHATVVDVVVNNAGGAQPPAGETLASLAESWTAGFRTNVLSAVLLTAALQPMLRRPGGRVVLIGSKAARTGGASAAYVAAKAALEGWVRTLAASLGPDGITANVVVPGYIEGTELVDGRLSDERIARILGATASGRPGETDDIAAAVRFLASPAARHVNGQALAVDGGDVPPS